MQPPGHNSREAVATHARDVFEEEQQNPSGDAAGRGPYPSIVAGVPFVILLWASPDSCQDHRKCKTDVIFLIDYVSLTHTHTKKAACYRH